MLASLLVVSASAWAGPSLPEPPELSPETRVLDNGLTVVVERQARTDDVSLYLKYRVGSGDERDGEKGCAHLFEHLMFEGSANVPQDMFDTWLTAAGGWNNAYTSQDETVYHMTFPSGALELALFLESDRMGFLDAGLDQDNLANQQKVVLQERRQGYNEPHGRDWDALQRLHHPEGHAYHVPVIGTVADIEGFSIDAVRAFWQTHYHPRNAVLVVVGNVEVDDTFDQIARWFADVQDAPWAAPEAPPTPPLADAPRDGVLFDAVEDRSFVLAWPTVPWSHPDAPVLEVVSHLLDNGRGSRLQDALFYKRELTTSVWTHGRHADHAGAFLVGATSARPPLKRLEAVVRRELSKLARKGPTEAELLRAQRAILAGQLDQVEQPEGRAATLLACHERYGEAACLEQEFAATAAVTPAEVREVVARYLTDTVPTRLGVVPTGSDPWPADAIPVELP